MSSRASSIDACTIRLAVRANRMHGAWSLQSLSRHGVRAFLMRTGEPTSLNQPVHNLHHPVGALSDV